MKTPLCPVKRTPNGSSTQATGRSGRRLASALAAALLLGALITPSAHAVPAVDGNGFFKLNSGQTDYFGYFPDTYNPNVPISLFVWMHGCGGEAYGDMFTIAPFATRANQSYIAISIGGRDGACWNMAEDGPKVLAAIEDVIKNFNINPRKIYIGGYSSGGDLAYRTGFQNAELFAGILAENTDPFRDTGESAGNLMGAAKWKLNIAHLAHLSDDVYPISTVRQSINTLVGNGFPATLTERPGTHYDDDLPANAPNSGTNYDLRTYLLPKLDLGWVSPDPATLGIAPKIAVTGKKKITTTKSSYKLKGTVPFGAATAAKVEVKVGSAKFKKAKGTTNWTFNAKLKAGNNRVKIRSVGTTGIPSVPIKITIVRK